MAKQEAESEKNHRLRFEAEAKSINEEVVAAQQKSSTCEGQTEVARAAEACAVRPGFLIYGMMG